MDIDAMMMPPPPPPPAQRMQCPPQQMAPFAGIPYAGVGAGVGMHQADVVACGVDDAVMEHEMQAAVPGHAGAPGPQPLDGRYQMHAYANAAAADEQRAAMEQRRAEENIALSGKVHELTQMLSAALDAGTPIVARRARPARHRARGR